MNEGHVRVGGRKMEIGRLRSLVSLAAGVDIGAGLAIGVVSAAPNGSAPELVRLPRSPRLASGRVTEVEGSTLTIAVPTPPVTPSSASTESPPIQTRIVRVLPQTRSPGQRPRTGDFVLAVGQPEADGSLTARAVTVRRPGQTLRRQAALTTTRAPGAA